MDLKAIFEFRIGKFLIFMILFFLPGMFSMLAWYGGGPCITLLDIFPMSMVLLSYDPNIIKGFHPSDLTLSCLNQDGTFFIMLLLVNFAIWFALSHLTYRFFTEL
jgi:hypothetical protein